LLEYPKLLFNFINRLGKLDNKIIIIYFIIIVSKNKIKLIELFFSHFFQEYKQIITEYLQDPEKCHELLSSIFNNEVKQSYTMKTKNNIFSKISNIKNQIFRILLFKMIELNDTETIKSVLTYSFNSLAFNIVTLNNSLSNLKTIFKYIPLNDIHDEHNYTLLMDCARYGDLLTFSYLIKNANPNYINYVTDAIDGEVNIFNFLFYNNDLRLLNYFIEHEEEFNYTIPSVNPNEVTKYLDAIFYDSKSMSKNIFKKIKILDEFYPCI